MKGTMTRVLLLSLGIATLILQQLFHPISSDIQTVMFLAGIILLGVPHGAADLLVAMQNAEKDTHSFSQVRFLAQYLLRIFLFGILLWTFPIAGIALFILFAAYHFGETDLSAFDTSKPVGRFFVASYGLVILGVMLLCHLDEVAPFLALAGDPVRQAPVLSWLHTNRIMLLFLLVLQFMSSALFLFGSQSRELLKIDLRTITRFLLILFILAGLPLILGFTFYFIAWHSVLSMQNIVHYLCRLNSRTHGIVIRQITLYSALAILGIVLVGVAGFMFASEISVMWYAFMGLAVLTAPHMEVMHEMYGRLRLK
jgi:Brp/Blh family beta-carotene 15,15'-monooxygenase